MCPSSKISAVTKEEGLIVKEGKSIYCVFMYPSLNLCFSSCVPYDALCFQERFDCNIVFLFFQLSLSLHLPWQNHIPVYHGWCKCLSSCFWSICVAIGQGDWHFKPLFLTVKDFERSRAFSFLSEVKKRFQTTYGSRAQTALPYAMNSEFSSTLAAQMVSPMRLRATFWHEFSVYFLTLTQAHTPL